MIIGAVRSGLVETVHPVAIAVVDAAGATVVTHGDATGREFFMRSAIKPVQAAVSQRNGAALGTEQLAVASASHLGYPVHVAMVEGMLLEVGLDAGHLRCPPDWAWGDAEVIWRERGRRDKERVFHNCSGKHAAMLRACVAQGWSLEYTDPLHPLQGEMVSAVEEATGRSATPVGVDGCSAPTMRSDTVGLAHAFASIATSPDFAEVRGAAMRYTALTRDGDQPEAQVARWLPTLVKGGAAGCVGIASPEAGVGVAAKSWSGESTPALLGALVVMDELGLVPPYPRSMIADLFVPPVIGGGAPVGRWEVISR